MRSAFLFVFVMLAVPSAMADIYTAEATRSTQAEACAAAKVDAKNQVELTTSKKVKSFSSCDCSSKNTSSFVCTVDATY